MTRLVFNPHTTYSNVGGTDIEVFFYTIAHFTDTHSIHSGFYQRRMIDDNQKIVIPLLAIDIDFFHSAFVNP
jgi:hypothetical protein